MCKCTLSLQGINEEVLCKNHLILGQHLNKDLEGRDFTLYGGAKFRSKDNKVTKNSNNHVSNYILETQEYKLHNLLTLFLFSQLE